MALDKGMERLLAEINRVARRGREAQGTDFALALLAKYERRYDEFIQAGWAGNPGFSPGNYAKKRRTSLPSRAIWLFRIEGVEGVAAV